MDSMDKSDITVWEGIPLLDILNIIYLGAEDVIPEDQVGTIKLYTCGEIHDIYRLDETKPTLKYADSINVRLDGPIATCGGTHYLEFNLFRGAYKGTVDLSWEPENNDLYVDNQTLESTDKTGKILVVTGRYANAMVANLEVKLLNSAARNVYGSIFSTNTIIQRPHCANVLLLEKPPTGIKIGKDGVITLSKSCVGVPLQSELILDLSLCVDAACSTNKTLSFNPNKLIDVQSVIMDKGTAVLSVRVTWRRTIVLFPCDDARGIDVEEDLALQFDSLKDKIRTSNEITPKIHLPCISRRILLKIIALFSIPVNPSEYDFNAEIAKPAYDLINLIQAAHFFRIKSLMEFACQTLMEKVSTKDPKVIMEEFEAGLTNARSERCHKRDQPATPGDHFRKVLKFSRCILRQRRKETFINKWRLVTVPITSYATKQLVTFERWYSVFDKYLEKGAYLYSIRDLEKLSEVLEFLIEFIIEDIKFADRLQFGAVMWLLGLIREIDDHKNMEIQGLSVTILSYAITRGENTRFLEEAVGEFVMFMSATSVDNNIMGVDALTRIAYALPKCVKLIIKQGALEKAHELLKKPLSLFLKSSCELIRHVANFLAAVCCGDFDFIEVNLALAISEELFQKKLGDNEHKMLACYALQYLTYENSLKIEEAAWEKLIASLIKFSIDFDDTEDITASSQSGVKDTGLAASALGVVGNVARWGYLDQIQTLAVNISLMECLRKMLRSGIKKFCKEACQIISNIAAAQNTPWIQAMYVFQLVEPLCKLLLEDMSMSDVKLEAAWAIFYGIYGDKIGWIDKIDKYPSNEVENKIYVEDILCDESVEGIYGDNIGHIEAMSLLKI